MTNVNKKHLNFFSNKKQNDEEILPFVNFFIKKTYQKYKIYRFFYFLINFLIIALTFTVVIITTLNISKLAFQEPDSGSNTFVFTTAIISSVSAFFSSIVNFFVIKDIYKKNWSNHEKIKIQKIEFDLKIGNYTGNEKQNMLTLFEETCSILKFGTRLMDYEKVKKEEVK